MISKTRLWAFVAVVSITANLFLVGLTVGRYYRPGGLPPPGKPFPMLRFVSGLDAQAQRIVDETERQFENQIRESMRQAGVSRDRSIETLCAATFDESAVRQQFEDLRKDWTRSQVLMHESLITAAKRMTSDQRKAMRQALKQGMRRGRPGDRGLRTRHGPTRPTPCASAL